MIKNVFIFALSMLSLIGFSQEKASRADIAKIIEQSGGSGQMNAAKKQVLTMISKEKQAAFIAEFDVFLKKVNERTIDVFLEEYSKEDIDAMIIFYNSPVGKKITQKAEVIATKTQEAVASLQGEMQAIMMKFMQ